MRDKSTTSIRRHIFCVKLFLANIDAHRYRILVLTHPPLIRLSHGDAGRESPLFEVLLSMGFVDKSLGKL